jgi:hypothetical protein
VCTQAQKTADATRDARHGDGVFHRGAENTRDEMEKGDRREPRRCGAGSTDVKDDDERDDDGDDGVDSPPCIPG